MKGKIEYVWNVLDNETRFLLTSNQSKTRSSADTRETFQKAKTIAGKKAKIIVTDRAFNYKSAVTKEFWSYTNRNPHKKYVSIKS